MKTLCLILTLATMSFNSFSQDKQSETTKDVTTYYFIRHAEKEAVGPTNKNPHLSEEGFKRAENWSAILGNIAFDAIYSTNFYRTIETASPTSKKNNLSITSYDFSKTMKEIDTFLKETKGKTVLIVGHSNTSPVFANAVIGNKKYENMSEDNFGNLYIVTIIDAKTTDQVLYIN